MSKEELIRQTFDELGKRYPIGLYEYLYKFQPDLYKELISIEADIDKAFLTGTVEELKASLRTYWAIHMKAIEIFKNSGQSGIDFTKVREEIEGERSSRV